MRPFPFHKPNPYLWRSRRGAAFLASLMLLGITGCRKSVRTDDPQLKPVQELLDAHLPHGTSEDKVKAFLGERGYAVLPSQKTGTVVAVIPDTGKREAATNAVQVTFYFDANGKLNTFSLERALSRAPKQ